MKIKFNSGADLPMKKTLKWYSIMIVVMMLYKTPEILAYQQRYHQKCLIKGRQYYEENEERPKKRLIINKRPCLNKKKN